MPDIPIEKVQQMQSQGLTNEDITRSLEGQGYNLDQISMAMNQAGMGGTGAPVGMEQSAMEEIPIPTQQQAPPVEQPAQQYQPQQQDYGQQYQLPQQQFGYEDIQAIVEEILEEKWKEFTRDVGDINLWKGAISDDLDATKQELVRTQKRLEDLQVAVLGKVSEYNKTMQDIGTDMKALESVFGKILAPLTSNIKDLDRITQDLKSKTKK